MTNWFTVCCRSGFRGGTHKRQQTLSLSPYVSVCSCALSPMMVSYTVRCWLYNHSTIVRRYRLPSAPKHFSKQIISHLTAQLNNTVDFSLANWEPSTVLLFISSQYAYRILLLLLLLAQPKARVQYTNIHTHRVRAIQMRNFLMYSKTALICTMHSKPILFWHQKQKKKWNHFMNITRCVVHQDAIYTNNAPVCQHISSAEPNKKIWKLNSARCAKFLYQHRTQDYMARLKKYEKWAEFAFCGCCSALFFFMVYSFTAGLVHVMMPSTDRHHSAPSLFLHSATYMARQAARTANE